MKALQACHFPTWTLNKLQQKFECKHHTNNEPSSMDIQPNNNNTNNSGTNNNKNISIVVPYVHGLGEKLKGHTTAREYKYTSKAQTL